MTKPSTRPSTQSKRNQNPLAAGLEKSLSTYAMVASSAGVALLACSQSVEAKIIYTKGNVLVAYNAAVGLDLNHDGQIDFTLSNVDFGNCSTTSSGKRHSDNQAPPPLGCPFNDQLKVNPAQAANEVWQAVSSYGLQCANDVAAGVRIGPLRHFASGKLVMSAHTGTSQGHYFCPWAFTPHSPYLGVKFLDTAGAVHFGWIRVAASPGHQARIYGFAYESTPNTPIVAGATASPDSDASLTVPQSDLAPQAAEPASLGRLA